VRKDPASGGSEDEIRQQVVMAEAVAQDLDSVVAMINALEVVRSQVATLKATAGDDATLADVRTLADSLDRKLVDVEDQLFQTRTTGRGQDMIRYPFKLGEQLVYFGQSVTSSDYAPTQPHKEVQAVLKADLARVRALFDRVMKGDVEAFRQAMRARGMIIS
jgi:hypothetical protein